MADDPRKPVVVASGHWGTIECAVRKGGAVPAQEFLEELSDKYIGARSRNSTAYTKFLVLFQQMAQHGTVSRKRFGPEGDGIFAFKHEIQNVQFRFACFQDGNKWVLTHGFKKPGAKKGRGAWPKEHMTRAKAIRQEYLDLKAGKPRHG